MGEVLRPENTLHLDFTEANKALAEVNQQVAQSMPPWQEKFIVSKTMWDLEIMGLR